MDISNLLINKGLCPPHSHFLLLEQIEVSTLWGNVYRLRPYKLSLFFAKLCIKVFCVTNLLSVMTPEMETKGERQCGRWG